MYLGLGKYGLPMNEGEWAGGRRAGMRLPDRVFLLLLEIEFGRGHALLGE